MICSFNRLIFPRSLEDVSGEGYMVASYHVHDHLPDQDGNLITEAKVVGYFLPTSKTIRYDLRGSWKRNKYGLQFELQGYDEIIEHSKEGIISYLSSGLIKGIGKKMAERIYDAFGQDTLQVLDNDPEKLLKIKGISEGKLKRISESYMAYRGARDVITTLAAHGVSASRAFRIYKQFGAKTMDIIRNHPYRLSDMWGIGFRTSDAIARSMGLSATSDERIEAALLHTLKEAETGGQLFKNSGSVCLNTKELIEKCLLLLSAEKQITSQTVLERIRALIASGEMISYGGMLYRQTSERSERLAASHIAALLQQIPIQYGGADLDAEIDMAEQDNRVILAKEQRHAVKTCLTSHVSIITGGPGTGKTMIQRIILDIFRRLRPEASILCCAPTGRAARRMEQSTGHEAFTVHRALNIMADEDGILSTSSDITADLVLVDEVSMMDIHLAERLLSAVPAGSQLILIGDVDQLPSIGPGAVLADLINSGVLPVIRLDKVYRQAAGSRVATNAALIRHGTVGLDYGEDFTLLESPTFDESAKILSDLYVQEVQEHGIDNVVLLSPFREKTATGVTPLNERLQEMVNPPAPDKPECKYGRRLFRLHDKVMQTKNEEMLSNGDIGYITGIYPVDDDTAVLVDFGDGRTKEYISDDLKTLQLAYATTVHKSQGSEYHTVLLSLQTGHYMMLKRPLLYTAITRAKEEVIIVGQRKALCMAIQNTDTEKRQTMLAERLCRAVPLPLLKAQ